MRFTPWRAVGATSAASPDAGSGQQQSWLVSEATMPDADGHWNATIHLDTVESVTIFAVQATTRYGPPSHCRNCQPAPRVDLTRTSLILKGSAGRSTHARSKLISNPSDVMASAGMVVRGRDRSCERPPAQIPACTASALGSCLGYGRQIAPKATDAECERRAAIASRDDASASSSPARAGCGAQERVARGG